MGLKPFYFEMVFIVYTYIFVHLGFLHLKSLYQMKIIVIAFLVEYNKIY